ncbi:MAG TPA: hypothetical protein VEJ42_07200 [Streptosporangiaceae bacterium]|nr:hypothetical protein [Streptosporangiaceae bacterium]
MTTATAGATPDFDLAAPLHTDDDVLRRVDLLLDENARQLRSVVLLFLAADGTQRPVVVPIDDVPERPDPMLVDSVCWVLAEALAQHAGGAAVIVLTRPGAGQPAEADMRWCRLLDAAARRHRAVIRMVCLATPAGVRSLAASPRADTAG